MSKLYYSPPTDEQFNELKEKAIELWSGMGSEPSYSKEKIDSIKDVGNVEGNFMLLLAMFDSGNQAKVISKLSEETKEAIKVRMIDGGNQGYYLKMIGL